MRLANLVNRAWKNISDLSTSTQIKLVGYTTAVLGTQLDAIIGSIAHPETPYADPEHIAMGVIFGGVVALLTRRTSKHVADRERKLRESEQTLETVTQCIKEGIILMTPDHEITWANETELNGSTLEEVQGKLCHNVTHDSEKSCQGADHPCVVSLIGTGNHANTIHTHYDSDGQRAFIELNAYTIRDEMRKITGYVHISRDITARVEAEKTVDRTRKRFELAISNAPIPIMIHAEDGEVLQISDMWTKKTSYTLEDIPTIQEWTKRAYGEKKDMAIGFIDQLYRLGTVQYDGEWPVTTKGGKKQIWAFHSAPLGKDVKNRRLVISTAFDVTDRKKVEAILERESARYKEFFYESGFDVYTSDADGKLTTVNPGLTDLLGYDSSEELVGHPVSKLYAYGEEGINKELDTNKYLNGKKAIFERKDGKRVKVRLTAKKNNGTAIYIVSEIPSGEAEFFITICANCKSIREGSQNSSKWAIPANYFMMHKTEIQQNDYEFSHGICPPCADKFLKDDSL